MLDKLGGFGVCLRSRDEREDVHSVGGHAVYSTPGPDSPAKGGKKALCNTTGMMVKLKRTRLVSSHMSSASESAGVFASPAKIRGFHRN